MARYELDGFGIVYLHEHQTSKLINAPRNVWVVDYPNGWSRRVIMDSDGAAIYTRWIKPKEKK